MGLGWYKEKQRVLTKVDEGGSYLRSNHILARSALAVWSAKSKTLETFTVFFQTLWLLAIATSWMRFLISECHIYCSEFHFPFVKKWTYRGWYFDFECRYVPILSRFNSFFSHTFKIWSVVAWLAVARVAVTKCCEAFTVPVWNQIKYLINETQTVKWNGILQFQASRFPAFTSWTIICCIMVYFVELFFFIGGNVNS